MSETLTEFLLARIAEDEARFHTSGGGTSGDMNADYIETLHERLLVECEAKRRIVDAHKPFLDSGYETCSNCGATVEDWRVDAEHAEAAEEGRPVNEWWAYPCRTLRILATVYADQPDFREEWRV